MKKEVYKRQVLCYNGHVSNTMTELDYLKTDLDLHTKSRDGLKDGTDGYFYRREGYDIKPLVAVYDKIIKSLQEEISSIEGKKRSKKSKKH